MFKNYFLLAVKNFRKQKMFSMINILGLTVGITLCLLIFLFVFNEFSYDDFHVNGKDIYRVMRVSQRDGEEKDIPYLAPPYATALKNDFPSAIKNTLRVQPDNDLVSYKQVSFNEKKIYLADSNFFSFFSFKLLKGDPATVLNDPLSIVMTASAAKKYFGTEDPIGKVIDFNKDLRLTVTGIAEDVPVNSHLDFDMVVPIANWRHEGWFNQWRSNSLFVYVQLQPGVNAASMANGFSSFMDKYLGDFFKDNGFKMGLTMHPLRGIYFEGESRFDNVKHGNKKMVYIFMSIAALILLIACINFMNLATARATDRSKEVGLRKVMGAVRGQLASQFLFESVMFAVVAALLSVLLLQLLMPAYCSFLGYTLPVYWTNPGFYLFLLGVIVIVGILAGSYPALLMSSFSPIQSLRGKLRTGRQGSYFRKALVVFQFAVSVLLIVSVAVVLKQLHYVRTTDLGFDKEQSMIVRIDNRTIYHNMLHFRNSLAADPAVKSVSLMSGEPGGFHDSYGFEAEGAPGQKLMLSTEFADLDYAKTLGLTILAGRDFSAGFPADTTDAVLINESAAAKMGYTPSAAIGKWVKNVTADSSRRTIVGVVKDYHFSSLREPIGPLVISPKKGDRRLALIKLSTTNLPATIRRIKSNYGDAAPGYPFEYTFLDDSFDKLYLPEMKQETLLTIFSMLAICIACLGLFGLASYTAVKRTREIGIRKVVGSSAKNIVFLLSKDLLQPVMIGTLLAIPIGYVAMNQWLQGFAYRTPVSWWLYVLAVAVAVGIALLTVSYQAIKAAGANPVKSLRTE